MKLCYIVVPEYNVVELVSSYLHIIYFKKNSTYLFYCMPPPYNVYLSCPIYNGTLYPINLPLLKVSIRFGASYSCVSI